MSRGWTWGLAGVATTAVLAVGAMWFGRASGPPRVTPLGCAVLWAEGRCELKDDRTLRLLVEADPDAGVSVYQNGRRIEPTILTTSGDIKDERLLSVTLAADVERVTVVVRRPGDLFALKPYSLSVRERREPAWLREARIAWNANRAAEAQELLRKHMDSVPRAEHAQALAMLGRIAREQSRFDEAARLLAQAIDEDHAVGLISGEALEALTLSRVLGEHQARITDAERVLHARDAAFARLPDLIIWRDLQIANYRWMRGDLAGAYERAGQGIEQARRFGDRDAESVFRELRAEVLAGLGRYKEAEDAISGVEKLVKSNCRKAGIFALRGWIGLARLESLPRSARRTAPDPQPSLRRAFELRRDHCDQRGEMASDLTWLAWAALLYGEMDEAEAKLRAARAALVGRDAWQELQWLDLEGRIALARGRPREAEATFRRLLAAAHESMSRTTDRDGKSTSGPLPKDNFIESVWRAWIGIAEANESIDPAEARRAYAQAEAYLDDRMLDMPLGAGRSSFLGRHEAGTGRFIALLVKAGLPVEASAVLRHARARALLWLGNLARVATWSDEARQAWRDSLETYRRTRHEIEEVAREYTDGDNARRIELNPRRLELEKRALVELERALAGHQLDMLPQTLRGPAPGEALLACHPAPEGWICLVAVGDRVEARTLDRMDPAALEAKILPLVDGASRLRVIAYGGMRDLDLGALAIGGRRLDERLAITWALDVPVQGAPDPRAGERRALLLLDPRESFKVGRTPEDIRTVLEAARWEVTLHRGDVTGRGARLDGAALRQAIETAQMFLYFGHADSVGGRESGLHALRTEDHAGFPASDVLTLARVPRMVVLAGCSSGDSSEGSGGVEGLGLVQAFLLRGARWTIAAIRTTNARVTNELVAALYRNGLASLGPDADPDAVFAVLRTARRETRQRLSGRLDLGVAEIDDTLESFRVYAP